ncbi:type II secretion system protein GspF, partial [Burkholderia sp. RS02]
NALKQKILLAFTYPGIVTLIAFGIVTFLLSYVVPQVVNVFASTKQQLPILTVVMMALSEFVRHWWWAILIVVALVVWFVKATLSRAGPRLAFDRWV